MIIGRQAILIVLLLVSVHFVFLLYYFEPAISTPDAQSYFTQAKLIAREGKTYFEPESILEYIGPHWYHTEGNRYYCVHAPGLPAVLSVIYKVFGPRASLLVNPIIASLSLFGLFLLCRSWIDEAWALLAVALMAVNPFANEHALFGDSHTAVCFFLIWALFFLVQWIKKNSSGWALAAGLFAGIIPTIRYPELLFCLAFGTFILFHFKKDRLKRTSLLAAAIGTAIPIGALCARNQMAFGAFWKTGYSLVSTDFSLNYLVNHSLLYLQKLMSEGCALIFGLGVIGIAVLCTRRKTWKQGILFATLVAPITLLYMSYSWPVDPQSMRFLLPTFFIYTIAGVWFLYLYARSHRPSAWAASTVLLLITIWWGLPQSHKSMQHLKNKHAVLTRISGIIEKNVEPGSILIANEGINQYLDLFGRWRLVDPSVLKLHRAKSPETLEKASRNIKARFKYRNLSSEELFNTFSADVWQWAGSQRKVYIVGYEENINDYRRQLLQNDKLEMIKEIELQYAREDKSSIPPGFKPLQTPMAGIIPHPQGPQGYNRIFDLVLCGEPLLLAQWRQESPKGAKDRVVGRRNEDINSWR